MGIIYIDCNYWNNQYFIESKVVLFFFRRWNDTQTPGNKALWSFSLPSLSLNNPVNKALFPARGVEVALGGGGGIPLDSQDQ